MVNRYQRRNSRPQAGPNFMNNNGPRHRPRAPPYQQPPMPTHGGTFIPSPPFSPAHYFQGLNSIFAERAYLLSSLQREDLRATAILTAIADINARMALEPQTRGREMKFLRRDLATKRHTADMSASQEKLILQRLGEVTFMIQQRERWWRVERGRERGCGVEAVARMEVGTGGDVLGGWNGPWVPDERAWNGQQVPCEGQPQGYYAAQGWGQQLPAQGYVTVTPPASTEGCGPTGHNDWQAQVPIDSCSDWDMSRVSGGDVVEQRSPQGARSDSMVELAAGRRRAQSRMSMPDLGSRSWGGEYPLYLGYWPSGSSLEYADGSDN
ncbi:hypothetical protein VE03_08393 [Pseudogymnoascus sp. 23342-1-I1]|nr:hypothetical protein VE03_08393 [Pseudogymnoascus sp. 23342-1-I1]